MIRIATLEDSLQLQKLYKQLNPDDPIIDTGKFKTMLEKISNNDFFKIYLNEINGNIASSCYLNIIPNFTRNGYPYAIIENVVTDSKFRNKGYGKEIITYAIEQAWQNNCYKVMLMTSSKEEAVINFYHACGFSSSAKTGFVIRNNKP